MWKALAGSAKDMGRSQKIRAQPTQASITATFHSTVGALLIESPWAKEKSVYRGIRGYGTYVCDPIDNLKEQSSFCRRYPSSMVFVDGIQLRDKFSNCGDSILEKLNKYRFYGMS